MCVCSLPRDNNMLTLSDIGQIGILCSSCAWRSETQSSKLIKMLCEQVHTNALKKEQTCAFHFRYEECYWSCLSDGYYLVNWSHDLIILYSRDVHYKMHKGKGKAFFCLHSYWVTPYGSVYSHCINHAPASMLQICWIMVALFILSEFVDFSFSFCPIWDPLNLRSLVPWDLVCLTVFFFQQIDLY